MYKQLGSNPGWGRIHVYCVCGRARWHIYNQQIGFVAWELVYGNIVRPYTYWKGDCRHILFTLTLQLPFCFSTMGKNKRVNWNLCRQCKKERIEACALAVPQWPASSTLLIPRTLTHIAFDMERDTVQFANAARPCLLYFWILPIYSQKQNGLRALSPVYIVYNLYGWGR